MVLYFRIGLDTIIIVSLCLIYFFGILIYRAVKLSRKELLCLSCNEVIKIPWFKLIFTIPSNNEFRKKCSKCRKKSIIRIKIK